MFYLALAITCLLASIGAVTTWRKFGPFWQSVTLETIGGAAFIFGLMAMVFLAGVIF